MRRDSEILARVRELVQEELDRRIWQASERLPCLCLHNYQHTLDTRKQVDGEPNEGYNRITDDDGEPVKKTIGLCRLGIENAQEWSGTICEEPIDAKKCPYFTPFQLKEDILCLLREQLSHDIWVRENLPEVHALCWVLECWPEFRLPWWKRILIFFRIRRLRLEPVVPPIDPSRLLQAPEEEVASDPGEEK
jgi:hypothetical protein